MITEEILALLDGLPSAVRKFDGEVEGYREQVIADELLPYVVLWMIPGPTVRYRKAGRSQRRSGAFQLTSVGLSRAEAQALAEDSRALVEGKRVAGGLVTCTDSDYVRPDNDVKTTDNRTVFYAVEQFNVNYLK